MQFTVGIAVLGCGTVGSQVADRLQRDRHALEHTTGVRYELCGVAIRDAAKDRPGSLERRLFTRDARALIDDPKVDVVVELIGGTAEAAPLVEHALERGRHVVTANKDLIGTQGPRLRALADVRGVALRFDAAVAGAIPLLRTLGEALAGDEVRSVAGVVNGTCTFVLEAMERGASLPEALACARELGYAEADARNDLDGTDAAHKLAAIAQLAFGLAVISPRIACRGIAAVAPYDIDRARRLGRRIRLVAATARTRYGIAAEVAPVLVAAGHEFGRTAGVENVVIVDARDAGRLTLRGAGAGGCATASAVLGDVVAVLRSIEHRGAGVRGRGRALDPVPRVTPFFDSPVRFPDLTHFPVWDDAPLAAALATRASA